jgi:gliding motility-associated-like protein
MKKIIILLLLFYPLVFLSQTRTDNWAFGQNAGINISALNGNISTLNSLNIYAVASVSSISSKNGILDFYTNGSVATNRNNNFFTTSKGLGGEVDKAQSTIIIPKPDSSNIYYIFSTREKALPNIFDPINPGFYYSEINVTTNEISTTRTTLLTSATSKISAVHHSNGKDIWVVVLGMHLFEGDSEETRAFFSFKITNSGIEEPIIKKLRETDLPKNGAMKISPDGTRLAYTSLEDGISYHNFNSSTGSVSSRISLPNKINPIKDYFMFGLEFSKNTEYLYTTSTDEEGYSYIHQYNLTTSNIFRRHTEIYKSSTNIDENYGALQIASDGKIYYSINKGLKADQYGNSLGVIEEPEKEGLSSNYVHNKINLGSGKSNLGLPSFIQSYFNSQIITEKGCVNIPTTFIANAYADIEETTSWDFGDGTTGIGANPQHTYLTTGKYTVTAILAYDGQKLRVSKEIEIFPLPEVISDQELVQCDSNGSGIAFYNLNEISNQIVLEDSDKSFIFYEKETDAIDDTNRISNPSSYENISLNQEIFVRVIDPKACYSITNFTLKTTTITLPNIETIYTCNNNQNDLKGTFNLAEKRNQIIQNFNLSNNETIRFYPSLIEAQTTTNLIDDNFTSPSTTIYVRVDTELGCGGIEPFNLVVNNKPQISINDSYTICVEPSKHTPINLDANSFNDRFEWKNSNGVIISTNQNFTLNTVGNYSLTVYKTENNIECSNYKEFTVSNPEAAIFNQINVDTETDNNTVYVSLNGNSNYEFSLDNKTFFGNGTDYTFNNVTPGLRTIYVKDIQNCEPSIKTNAAVIGFKKFFSPNGDGINDYWNLNGLDAAFFKSIKIIVFDRYGKILHSITDFNSLGWDGNYNGKVLGSNSYWFIAEIVDLEDHLIKKSGNFSLIRK